MTCAISGYKWVLNTCAFLKYFTYRPFEAGENLRRKRKLKYRFSILDLLSAKIDVLH